MITLTELRKDIYNKISNVIATGIPTDVKYKGHIVKIILADHQSKLSNIAPKDLIVEGLESYNLQQPDKKRSNELP